MAKQKPSSRCTSDLVLVQLSSLGGLYRHACIHHEALLGLRRAIPDNPVFFGGVAFLPRLRNHGGTVRHATTNFANTWMSVEPPFDYQGAIEIRLLSRPFASTDVSESEQLGVALRADDVMAVSYVPIEGPNEARPSGAELTPGLEAMQGTLARLEAAGLSTDYVFRGGSFDLPETVPTNLIYIPGAEHAIVHAVKGTVKGIIWVYHQVSPAVEAAAAVNESVELIEKVSKELRSGSDQPVKGGALEDASTVARQALAQALDCNSDNSTLSFIEGSPGHESGVFVCLFRRKRQRYRVTVAYQGKRSYAVRTIEKADPGSGTRS